MFAEWAQHRNFINGKDMDWFIIIVLLTFGILYLKYIIRSYINRNDYETAIKSKDWQNDLRYNTNLSRPRSVFTAVLLIMFAFFLIYLKLKA